LETTSIHLGHATHVVDRFHVVRWFASGLIEVRRRVQRIGDEGESPAFSPVIFRTRYLQLARADHLNPEQLARLFVALTEDPELYNAWRLLQQLYRRLRRRRRDRGEPSSWLASKASRGP
jgi:transposase